MSAILEINDYELTLYRGAQALYQAPAIAIVNEREIVFGEAALRQFRLFPRASNLQYLAKLNADPLSQPVKLAANHADLVYLQLKELLQICSEDLLLAVPGNLKADQLGVLLGIAQEVGFTISGFVDIAVAALATNPAPPLVYHVDIHLQHAVITELEVTGEVRRIRAEEIRDCGVANLVDSWLNLIADRFVAATRFDPLHTADTEQQLYNQVFNWLSGVHTQQELTVVINHAGSERRVEIPRSELENKAAARYQRILDALPAAAEVVASARIARIPGFASTLRSAGHRIQPLAQTAVGDGIAANLAAIADNDSGLRLITTLPHEHGATIPVATPHAGGHAESLRVTHLLEGHTAFTPESLPVIDIRENDGEQWLQPNAALTLNGRPVASSCRICPGDVIEDGTRSLLAIRVQPDTLTPNDQI